MHKRGSALLIIIIIVSALFSLAIITWRAIAFQWDIIHCCYRRAQKEEECKMLFAYAVLLFKQNQTALQKTLKRGSLSIALDWPQSAGRTAAYVLTYAANGDTSIKLSVMPSDAKSALGAGGLLSFDNNNRCIVRGFAFNA